MVLAAGHGTRLKPLTDRIPKAMVPVGGKPILEHTIEALRRSGVEELVVNLCHLPHVVSDHLGDGGRWGVKITYSIEKEALGTAGGVKKAASFFDGPFFVWYGDNLSGCDLTRLYAFHRTKGGIATIALFHRDEVTASGIAGLDEDGRITCFVEKPGPEQVFSHWVNAGIYILEPEVLEAIPGAGNPDFGRDVFPALLTRGAALYGYRMSEDEGLWWIDTPEDLRRVQKLFSTSANSKSANEDRGGAKR